VDFFSPYYHEILTDRKQDAATKIQPILSLFYIKSLRNNQSYIPICEMALAMEKKNQDLDKKKIFDVNIGQCAL